MLCDVITGSGGAGASGAVMRAKGGARGRTSASVVDRASRYQFDKLDADKVEDEEETLEKVEKDQIRRHKNRRECTLHSH